MIYDVVAYGHPVLREKAIPVKKVDLALRNLARDMLDTMHAYSGIGLAAEQIARTEAICVIDLSPADERDGFDVHDNPDIPMPLILVNPEIVASAGEVIGQEGCLSFPDTYVDVKRAEEVTVKYLSMDNEPAEVSAKGLLSRAIQHEIDHLNGILIVDRMSATQKVTNAGKLKRLSRMGKQGGVVPPKTTH